MENLLSQLIILVGDAIIPNKTGLLIPIKNTKRLVEAINILLSNKKEFIKMIKNSRSLALKKYNIEDVVHNHTEIYDSF